MAGGTWTAQNKVRPGVYINFATAETGGLSVGERGTVAIAQVLDWGAFSEVQTVEAGTDTTPMTGYALSDTHNLFLQQIFLGTNRTSGANKVLLYRLPTTGNVAASVTTGNLTATAKYAGTRGNDISISITADPDTEGSFIVSTMVDGATVDTQNAATVAGLIANDWVTFSGTGELAATTGVALANGANGTLSASTAYASFLTAIEPLTFDVLVYDGADTTVQSACISFAKRMAEDNGKNIQLVTANATAPDSRFIINVHSGVTLADGTTLTAQQVCWWVGGATAGAAYNQSITYAVYPNAVAVNPPLSNAQYEAGINAGWFLLFDDHGTIKVETDINSLTTYTPDIGKVYRKNRVMRLCNTIANDIYAQFSANYIGTTNNNEEGRALLRGSIVGYLQEIQNGQGIQNFTADDVEVLAGNEVDAVVVNIAIQPVDSVEKIYMTITVG